MIIFMQRISKPILFFFLTIALFEACTIQRTLPEGGVYFEDHFVEYGVPLVNVEGLEFINSVKAPSDASADELLSLTKVKPNRKILFFRFNMRMNTLVPRKALARSEERIQERCIRKNKRKVAKNKPQTTCNGLWPWLAYTVGEPPALMDSALAKKSAKQMEIFLEKRGYFNAHVTPDIQYNENKTIFWDKNKSCRVYYQVDLGEQFEMQTINWDIQEPKIKSDLENLKSKSLLQTGNPFHVDVLSEERNRITTYLKNIGYFEFIPDYIVYDVDTTTNKGKANLTLHILNPKEVDGFGNYTGRILPHRKFYFGKVSINVAYDPNNTTRIPQDTSIVSVTGRTVEFLSNGAPVVKPDLLASKLRFKCVDYWKYEEDSVPQNIKKLHNLFVQNKIDDTYKEFSQLGVFKNVNIQMTPVVYRDTTPMLDVRINLYPHKKQSLAFDPRITNRAGNMGVYSNFTYKHKNLFHGAETFEFKTILGLEATQTIGSSGTDGNAGNQIVERAFQLNTFEIGPELNLNIPQFFPNVVKKYTNQPYTTLRFTANYQKRPDYERTLSQLGFGWKYMEDPERVSSVHIEWAEISLIKINKSAAFQSWLNNLNDGYLNNSYQDHLIVASSIGYNVNTQLSNDQPTYFYYNATILEAAGNALRGLFNVLPNVTTDANGSYSIQGIRFAQYLKTEHDFRYYTQRDAQNKFAFRGFLGVGMPFKNLNALPFEKSYFSGGANGIRAWQARTLGPGSYRDSTAIKSFNNIGDLKIEFNAEYRFSFTDMFQGAVFVDAGNIWLMNKNSSPLNADFQLNRFYKEFAIGAGLGARLDFDFFLIRLDMGIPIRNPIMIEGERWIWEPKTEFNQFLTHVNNSPSVFKPNLVFNLGIGFPF
jgi:outer membrane protein assembly factor BamA